ncbi:MAG: aldolase [Acidobacteria bacterium]|nr:aldolase [Acidobacteriota bacterium]
MTPSKALAKLRTGSYITTAAMTRITEPWFAEILGRTGFDVIWYDLEHRAISANTIDAVSLACRHAQIDLMVRIRKTGYNEPMQMLECGANGIMVPHCCSAAEARQWVDWARFPPEGRRGLDGSGADADWGLADMPAYVCNANRETFLILQIEDREALDQIDEIAAVPGYDLLFVGPADLCMSLGVPFQFDHPLIEAAHDKVAAAAAKHGKWWGTITSTAAIAQRMLDKGARMVTCGADQWWLMRGAKQAYGDYCNLSVR